MVRGELQHFLGSRYTPRCVVALLLLSQFKTLSPKYGPLDFGPPLPVTSSKRKEIPIPYYYDYTYRDKYRYNQL